MYVNLLNTLVMMVYCGAPAYQDLIFIVSYVCVCIVSTFGQGKAQCTVLVYISVLLCILV